MTLQLVLQLQAGLLVSGEGGIGEACSAAVGNTVRTRTFSSPPCHTSPDHSSRVVFWPDPETTNDGDVETLLDVFASAAPGAHTHALFLNPRYSPRWTANGHLHAKQTDRVLENPSRFSCLSSTPWPEMLILQVPSGWSMSGSGFSESCTGQCTASMCPGDQRSVELEMQPNQAGSFTVEAQMEWWFGEDTSTLDGKAVSLPLNVIPLATPVPTALPRATQPSFPPPSNGDGSLSTPGSGSLVLLGLLILPVVGLIARPLLARPDVPRRPGQGLHRWTGWPGRY